MKIYRDRKKEKGFTMIEMMFSFLIFLSIVIMFYGFLSNYYYKSSEVGESLTAKILALNYIETESNELLLSDNLNEVSYKDTTLVKKTLFTVDVSVVDVTDEFSHFSDKFKLYEITSKVKWGNRKNINTKKGELTTRSYEVSTYVNKIEK